MNGGHPPRIRATSVFAITLAVVLAGCGASSASPSLTPAGTPVPSATATSTAEGSSGSGSSGSGLGSGSGVGVASPSPSPKVDVAKAFVAYMTTRRFSANATVVGGLTVGPATFPISGTLAMNGPDNHQSMTIAFAGASQTTETLTTGGVSYANRGGLWFQKPAAPEGSGLGSAFRSMLDVADVGVETRNGKALHHLKPRGTTTIPLSAIGTDDPAGDGKVEIEFYVLEDGTPVVMALSATWTQIDGAKRQPARMTLDYTFAKVGGEVTVAAPQQVWATFKSKRFGYSIAYPSDWEARQSGGKTKPDTIESAEATGVYANRYARSGSSLNSITSFYIADLKRSSKAKVTANTASKIAGIRARRLEWTAVYEGTRTWNIEVVVVRGKYVYYFAYSSLERITDRDRALFDDFLSSLTLTSK